jgi:protein SSD1
MQAQLQEQQSPMVILRSSKILLQMYSSPAIAHVLRCLNPSVVLGRSSTPQPQLVQLPQGQVMIQQPQLFAGQQLNPSAQSATGTAGCPAKWSADRPSRQPARTFTASAAAAQQQQRKTLSLRTFHKLVYRLFSAMDYSCRNTQGQQENRSDAYVTTSDLDADIFICGSKDRNRALEGDLVAVELLDVDEVWGQKREKEEKKKRKDITDARTGGSSGGNDKPTRSDSGTNGDSHQSGNAEGGLRRRGSLRQRPTQKKNDDVEVEGQSLLLMEEEEVNDEQKPLYAGHVVAVIERVAGQMFSALWSPSS